MSTVQDVPLADLCREADSETFTAFVVDLYEARGWTVDRTDDGHIEISAGDETRRVGVLSRGDIAVPAETLDRFDTIVTPSGSDRLADVTDVSVVDPETLGRQLAYAVERPVARNLLWEHFDWSPQRETGPTDSNAQREQDAGGGFLPQAVASGAVVGNPRVVLVSVLIVAAAGGAAFVVASQLGDSGASESQQPQDALAATPTPTPPEETTTEEATPTPDSQSLDTEDRNRSYPSLPPGIDQSGDIDRVSLTDAHESVLDNQSYRLTLTYRERVAGKPTGFHSETIRVRNETIYSASVTRHGRLRAPVPAIADGDVYANGSVRFERTDNGSIQRGAAISYDRYLAGHIRFLSVFLDVGNSTITDYSTDDNRATAYVVTDGNRATLIDNTTGGFTAREDGLVTGGRWSYDFSTQLTNFQDVTGTFELRISDVGTTSVRKPEWVPANATDAGGEITSNETTPNGSTPTPTPNGSTTNETTPTPEQSD